MLLYFDIRHIVTTQASLYCDIICVIVLRSTTQELFVYYDNRSGILLLYRMRYFILKILGNFSNTLTNMPVTFDSVCFCYFVICCFFASFFGGGRERLLCNGNREILRSTGSTASIYRLQVKSAIIEKTQYIF